MAITVEEAYERVVAARAVTSRTAAEGLAPILALLPPEERPRLTLLARDMHGWLYPADAVGRAAVDRATVVAWRRELLDRIEIRLLYALAEGRSAEGLPSLTELCRARRRADADEANTSATLERLQRFRPKLPAGLNSARLAFLAERAAAQERLAAAAAAAVEPEADATPVPAEREPAGAERPSDTTEMAQGAAEPVSAGPAQPAVGTEAAPPSPVPSAGGATPPVEPVATTAAPEGAGGSGPGAAMTAPVRGAGGSNPGGGSAARVGVATSAEGLRPVATVLPREEGAAGVSGEPARARGEGQEVRPSPIRRAVAG